MRLNSALENALKAKFSTIESKSAGHSDSDSSLSEESSELSEIEIERPTIQDSIKTVA